MELALTREREMELVLELASEGALLEQSSTCRSTSRT